MPIDKDQLRDRLDILDVIGQYVRLQRAGTEWRGLCPFHDEKTPSFYVNADKGFWKCRGACDAGGDVFSFLMRAEKLEFREAAELLANRIGCTLQRNPGEARKADERERVLEVTRLATELFEKALWNSAAGEVAREYLRERGLNDEIVHRFRLGYAPASWDSLARYLRQHDVALTDAEAAGLVKARERSDGYYDRFRGRVMFPILDPQGRTVGFGGRVLDPHDEPKYLNSPESPVFSKGRLLYGLPFAVGSLTEGAVVVEGYMDVIALHQHGIVTAVATLGTALTEEHLRLLRRHTQRVTLCYDADLAGTRATDRAAAAFIAAGVQGRVLSLPDGMDPDEYVRAYGQQGFADLLANAPDLIDYRLQAALAAVGDDEQRRAEAVEETVLAILGDIADPVRQAQYVRRIAEWWSGEAVGLQEQFERTLTRALRARGRLADDRPRRPDRASRSEAERPSDRTVKVERRLLQVLLQQPALLGRVTAQVTAESLSNVVCREVYSALLVAGPASSADRLTDELSEAGRRLVADLVCQEAPEPEELDRLLADWGVMSLEGEVEQLRRRRAELTPDDYEAQAALSRQILELEQRLQQARLAMLQPRSGMR